VSVFVVDEILVEDSDVVIRESLFVLICVCSKMELARQIELSMAFTDNTETIS
jgi:hypothetical protein